MNILGENLDINLGTQISCIVFLELKKEKDVKIRIRLTHNSWLLGLYVQSCFCVSNAWPVLSVLPCPQYSGSLMSDEEMAEH